MLEGRGGTSKWIWRWREGDALFLSRPPSHPTFTCCPRHSAWDAGTTDGFGAARPTRKSSYPPAAGLTARCTCIHMHDAAAGPGEVRKPGADVKISRRVDSNTQSSPSKACPPPGPIPSLGVGSSRTELSTPAVGSSSPTQNLGVGGGKGGGGSWQSINRLEQDARRKGKTALSQKTDSPCSVLDGRGSRNNSSGRLYYF